MMPLTQYRPGKQGIHGESDEAFETVKNPSLHEQTLLEMAAVALENLRLIRVSAYLLRQA